MDNQFTVHYEKLISEKEAAVIIGLYKNDIKNIAIELLKLEYGKAKKIVFRNEKNVIAELIKKEQFFLVTEENQMLLTDADLSLIMSFLLDATDEYMSYDHIDLELSTENNMFDICIERI